MADTEVTVATAETPQAETDKSAETEEGAEKSGLSTAARRKARTGRAKHSKRFLALI